MRGLVRHRMLMQVSYLHHRLPIAAFLEEGVGFANVIVLRLRKGQTKLEP